MENFRAIFYAPYYGYFLARPSEILNLTLFMVVCGVIDVRRHRKITYQLLEKYFLGNGLLTWMLSPLNLLADLLSHRNRVIYTLEDLPADHRREIEACVREFVDNGDRIKAHVAAILATNGLRSALMQTW